LIGGVELDPTDSITPELLNGVTGKSPIIVKIKEDDKMEV
jgi:hypothetical protein